MQSSSPDQNYYRELHLKAARFRVNLETKEWCDFWHQHFDWKGFGNLGWLHRRRHLAAVLKALCKARLELSDTKQPYQLFALIHPNSSGDDGIFVHTPNPNGSEFPCTFVDAVEIQVLPPLLVTRINLETYTVLSQLQGKDKFFIIMPRSRGRSD